MKKDGLACAGTLTPPPPMLVTRKINETLETNDRSLARLQNAINQ